MFSELMKESFRLVSSDGTVKAEKLSGQYADGKVTTFEVATPIVIGDHLLRMLPNGHVEDYVVTDPGFQQGVLGLKSRYEASVRHGDAPAASPQKVIQHITNNVSGPNARVNIGSTDNSANVINNRSVEVFQKLLSAAESGISDTSERQQIVSAINEMKRTHGSGGFIEAYKSFMDTAAAHMTVFAPILPALAALLS